MVPANRTIGLDGYSSIQFYDVAKYHAIVKEEPATILE
jgi:hypothetical protein